MRPSPGPRLLLRAALLGAIGGLVACGSGEGEKAAAPAAAPAPAARPARESEPQPIVAQQGSTNAAPDLPRGLMLALSYNFV